MKEGALLLKDGARKAVVRLADKGHTPGLGRARLARELFGGRFGPGQSVSWMKLQSSLEWTRSRC